MNKRYARDRNSILALRQLLNNVVLGSTEMDPALSDALRTQSLLAAYSSDDRGIVSMSLNHQKKTANEVLGSYDVLDSLRRRALVKTQASVKNLKQRKTSTLTSQRERIKALETMIKALSQDLLVLQRAFDLRCVQARAYATKAGDTELRQCDAHQRELEASFRLRTIDLPTDKVVPMRGRR
jgi:hypothetical protein